MVIIEIFSLNLKENETYVNVKSKVIKCFCVFVFFIFVIDNRKPITENVYGEYRPFLVLRYYSLGFSNTNKVTAKQ